MSSAARHLVRDDADTFQPIAWVLATEITPGAWITRGDFGWSGYRYFSDL